jgi:lipid-A-disaccharide synthase-like uncharacterized protein
MTMVSGRAAKRAVVVYALAMLVTWALPPEVARADATGSDAAIDQLLKEDPRLSELVRRDPALLEALRADPALAGRLAARPSLIEKAIETATNPWVLFGLGAQFLFMMRFLVQWIASERKRRSHVPVIFWYFSVGGGLTLLAYAIYRRDPVFILGQSLGLLVYIRNLVLIYRRAWAYRELLADRAEAARDESSAGVSVTGGSEPSPAS